MAGLFPAIAVAGELDTVLEFGSAGETDHAAIELLQPVRRDPLRRTFHDFLLFNSHASPVRDFL